MALFVGLSLTLTACGDDPDPEPPAPTLSVNGSASIEANGTVYGDITVPQFGLSSHAFRDIAFCVIGHSSYPKASDLL